MIAGNGGFVKSPPGMGRFVQKSPKNAFFPDSENLMKFKTEGKNIEIIDVRRDYKEEKPFLVMDDPFVNLDKEKMELAKGFLRAISKEYQVLYFTCHESRI